MVGILGCLWMFRENDELSCEYSRECFFVIFMWGYEIIIVLMNRLNIFL